MLKALYRLNPVIETDGDFNPTDDYPRRSLFDYEDQVANSKREPATVVEAAYKLETNDVSAIKDRFGSTCFDVHTPEITLVKGYENQLKISNLDINQEVAIRHLIEDAGLSQQVISDLLRLNSVNDMVANLSESEQTESVLKLTPVLASIADHGVAQYIFDEILSDKLPKFLYFDEYYQMRGHDNLNALKHRIDTNTLCSTDRPLIGLIDLAGLNLDELANPRRTEALIARLEAAEIQLTQKVLTYWSQNKHLRMKFDIRPALPDDGPGMTSGTNIWGRVEDIKNNVSTPLGQRSRGFVWFFSFLAWYSKLRKEGQNLILLLDEPGLSLHAKAQGDLLRYFEEELKPHHQLIYTTHSPFMVDSEHFDRVRIVQDLSIEADLDDLPEDQQGTKVSMDVLDATPDSLFPLQGALGYEIHQALFIGPNCLVVEGVSDLLYIQTLSSVLQRRGRNGLSKNWIITPVGGAGNVPTFLALIGAQTKLNVAVLIDFEKKYRQNVENLYKSKLLKNQQVLTFADFTGTDEADIEDMFAPEFYIKLVNAEYGISLKSDQLTSRHPRIIRRLEEYFKGSPLANAEFNHYRPARYFNENLSSLERELDDETLDRFERAFVALNELLKTQDG